MGARSRDAPRVGTVVELGAARGASFALVVAEAMAPTVGERSNTSCNCPGSTFDDSQAGRNATRAMSNAPHL